MRKPTICICENKGADQLRNQDPVVQSIVSLTISLRHKFVKQVSAKVTNTLLLFVEKNVRILCSAKDSHIFSTKNNSVFVIFMFEILTSR